MIPEAKAKELTEKFHKKCSLTLAGAHTIFGTMAKGLAIICVEEIINSRPLDPHPDGYYEIVGDRVDAAIEYWNKVLEHLKSKK